MTLWPGARWAQRGGDSCQEAAGESKVGGLHGRRPPIPAQRRDQDAGQGWPHRAGLAASRHCVPWAGRCPAQGTDHHLGVPAGSGSLAVLALAAATETQTGAPTTVHCPGPGIGRYRMQACAGLVPLASLLGEWTPSSPRVLTYFPSVHVPISSSRGDTGQTAWGPPERPRPTLTNSLKAPSPYRHILRHWGLEVQHRNLGDVTPSLSPTLPGSSELGAESPRVPAQESLRDTRHQSLAANLPKCKSPLVPRTTGRRVSRTRGSKPSPGQTALKSGARAPLTPSGAS